MSAQEEQNPQQPEKKVAVNQSGSEEQEPAQPAAQQRDPPFEGGGIHA